MLVSGKGPCCTRHPRSLLELTLGRPPWLPDAPEASGTPYTISYDSHPFFVRHNHPSLTRSVPLLVVVYWKNSLLVARQSKALGGGGRMYFEYNGEKMINNEK